MIIALKWHFEKFQNNNKTRVNANDKNYGKNNNFFLGYF